MTTAPGSSLFPQTERRHWAHRGLSERQEHIFTWIAVVIVLLFITAWVGAIDHILKMRREMVVALPMPIRHVTAAVFDSQAPTTAFISDAMLGFLGPLRGASGKVQFTTLPPGQTIVKAPENAKAVLSGGSGVSETSPAFAAPEEPGIYKIAVQIDQATRAIENFNVITLVPFAEKQKGRIGLYYLGNWPFEGRSAPKPAYANPSGFIEVTKDNEDTQISEHFRLRDFLTKDQPNVWPKYLLLNPKLLDKLELTIQELEKSGHPVRHMQIMSGFRTPQYNHTGGNTAGRANLSRHMYGDASDVFVDNDWNRVMDDLNHDGRIDVGDAEVIQQAVDRVEAANPSLAGGVGVYSACCGHGPFTHIDVRGYRARWRGVGNG